MVAKKKTVKQNGQFEKIQSDVFDFLEEHGQHAVSLNYESIYDDRSKEGIIYDKFGHGDYAIFISSNYYILSGIPKEFAEALLALEHEYRISFYVMLKNLTEPVKTYKIKKTNKNSKWIPAAIVSDTY